MFSLRMEGGLLFCLSVCLFAPLYYRVHEVARLEDQVQQRLQLLARQQLCKTINQSVNQAINQSIN